MGKNCSSEREPDTYEVYRSRGYPGFKLCPTGEVCLIVKVTSQGLRAEGLEEGSIITHVNGEIVKDFRDYKRFANPRNGSRFTMKVLPPEITGTYKLRGACDDPGIVVDSSLIVSGVDDPKFGGIINRKIDMINGVSLNGDFELYRKLTAVPGPYFMTLTPAERIPTHRVCNAMMRFNQEMHAKSTQEVEDWGRYLQRWKALLDDAEMERDYSEFATETEF